jgi:hypothetical protein
MKASQDFEQITYQNVANLSLNYFLLFRFNESQQQRQLQGERREADSHDDDDDDDDDEEVEEERGGEIFQCKRYQS